MVRKILMKGNDALGEAAIRAGCRFYFGYPITPQNELMEYMAMHLPEAGGVFIQSESELAGISMVYGASAAGMRAMTSSSSPGISLMQEGLSYMASAELPAVVVNVSRGGPGLGRIIPAQSDYFQATRGGGHGDYHLIVLTPNSVQEMAELTSLGFDLADKYRTPVLILGDAFVGQMMESIDPAALEPKQPAPAKPWAARGTENGEQHLIMSAPYTNEELIVLNQRLTQKYRTIAERETRYEEYCLTDAEIVLVAFGIVSRFCKEAVDILREQGYKVGLLRPITVYPYPQKPLAALAARPEVRSFLCIEMNEGQMLEDVKLAVNGQKQVDFFGGGGGLVTPPDKIVNRIRNTYFGGEA